MREVLMAIMKVQSHSKHQKFGIYIYSINSIHRSSFLLGEWLWKGQQKIQHFLSFLTESSVRKVNKSVIRFNGEIARPEEWMPLKYNLNLRKSDLQCGRRCLKWYLHCTYKRMFIASWEYQGKCWKMFWLYVDLRNWYLACFLGSR